MKYFRFGTKSFDFERGNNLYSEPRKKEFHANSGNKTCVQFLHTVKSNSSTGASNSKSIFSNRYIKRDKYNFPRSVKDKILIFNSHDSDHAFKTDENASRKRSSLLAKLVENAVNAFISIQTSHLASSQVEVSSRNRDLVRGKVKKLSVDVKGARYKGLNLTSAQLEAENISLDLRELKSGRILRTAFSVDAQLCMSSDDLACSLKSSLLQGFLRSLFCVKESKLESAHPAGVKLSSFEPSDAKLEDSKIILFDDDSNMVALEINIDSFGRELALTWTMFRSCDENSLTSEIVAWPTKMDTYVEQCFTRETRLFLGSETCLSEISIEDGLLRCNGVFEVTP
eukprot:CAMPEP_0196591450 /NCGR_PEP_ID=MMETSP1081-20130531/69674_1 /TAXON_ID=36882 /ORGANISM="Pyramimonas amylifera, Strain CCMP720" /LENGTH=340 /DNA_ID=CAMNT_0041914817 /DNA_START=12 /DNA_END=1034 /DNA_ORIENTATION=+